MKNKESVPGWNEIIFENRHKRYGAYELRTQYDARASKALLITLTCALLLFVMIYCARTAPKHLVQETSIDPVIFSDIDIFDVIPPVIENTRIDPPAPPTKSDPNAFLVTTDTLNTSPIDTTTNNPLTSTDTSGHYSLKSYLPDTIIATGKSGIEHDTFSLASVDKSPEFPGGMNKFYDFLISKIRYTEEARRNGLSGKMYISFIVDEAGLISRLVIKKRIGYGLDDEVMRVLSNSPAWSPGIVRNKPVKTEMILPVSFNLVQ